MAMKALTQTLQTWAFSIRKIPLIVFCTPRVVHLDKKRCELKIPLNYRTRNHVKSMYFGVLAVGADLAGGLFVMEAIKASKKPVTFIFKDFKADFLRLCKSDVHFHCTEGEKVRKAVAECIKIGKRVNSPINMWATTPKASGDEPVAKFTLTISVKVKN